MELRHFRYFVAVAEELHFARAAERLGISPPTLTVQIQEIERSLKARLFSRTKRSVQLTTAGETFLAEARTALAHVERALNAGRRAGRGELGGIALGYVGSAAFAGILQAQLRLFRQAWPEVAVHVSEWPMDALPAMLEGGRVDVAFVRLPVEMAPPLQAHVLHRDRFCVALPADHALVRDSAPGEPDAPIRARALAGETFILPEQALGTREVARRGRFEARIGAAPGGLLAVLAQVSLGIGVAIVPSVLVDVVSLPHVVFRPLAGAPIPSEIAAVFRRHEQAPAVKNLVRQLAAASAALR